MNELQNVDTLTAEILILKNQTAQNIIEIGKRLIAVKESLPYGEFGKWLEEKVDFTQQTANKFMKIANEIGEYASMRNLGTAKIFALLSVPQAERETFIKENPVNEMTTRELQQAIKEKKEFESKTLQLERQLREEQNKPPQIIEKERIVIPGDYQQAKSKFIDLTNKIKNKEFEIENLKSDLKNSKDGLLLKNQIDYLMKQKNDLSRQIQSATELSKLTVSLHSILKTELAPIKFSRCMEQLSQSDTALKNLIEIIEMVESWTNDIKEYLPNKNIINVEVHQ